jgi:PilZ domain
MRQYVGNRRRSRRYDVRLPFKLSLVSVSKNLNGMRRVSVMNGHTLDLSANGLALVVPKITLDEHHLVGENRTFNITLELPDGPIELQASPVRYERLDEEQSESGYLIAVKVMNMAEDERARWTAFIATLAKS